MQERIEKLENENKEMKEILKAMLNAMATLAECTSYGARLEVETIINYCNKSKTFFD